MWLNFVKWCDGVESKYHFKVYKDIGAYGRWLEAGDELYDALQMLDDLTDTTNRQAAYKNLAAISAILVCVQLLKNLNFHLLLVNFYLCPIFQFMKLQLFILCIIYHRLVNILFKYVQQLHA